MAFWALILHRGWITGDTCQCCCMGISLYGVRAVGEVPTCQLCQSHLFSSTYSHHKAEMNIVADVAIWCLHREKQWEALVCWWLTVACLSCRNMVRAQMRRRDDALTALDGAHDATGEEGAIFYSPLLLHALRGSQSKSSWQTCIFTPIPSKSPGIKGCQEDYRDYPPITAGSHGAL